MSFHKKMRGVIFESYGWRQRDSVRDAAIAAQRMDRWGPWGRERERESEREADSERSRSEGEAGSGAGSEAGSETDISLRAIRTRGIRSAAQRSSRPRLALAQRACSALASDDAGASPRPHSRVSPSIIQIGSNWIQDL